MANSTQYQYNHAAIINSTPESKCTSELIADFNEMLMFLSSYFIAYTVAMFIF